jgi:thioredoxin 1
MYARSEHREIRKMLILTDVGFRDEVLKSRQLVLVEFYTDWSGSHHIISPGLMELSDIYESRVKFCMVDVGNHKVLSEKYGIWNVPTIVLFKNGNPVDYIVGLVPKTVIAQKLNVLLKT